MTSLKKMEASVGPLLIHYQEFMTKSQWGQLYLTFRLTFIAGLYDYQAQNPYEPNRFI
jgi:hypothetical protein